uniref:Fucosyltransferase n=1 Tax=Monopterus albus TaxID=43700 RepID=A0A3Q3IRD3_MONAL
MIRTLSIKNQGTYLLLSFLCILLLCLFSIWLRGFQALTTINPFATSDSRSNRNLTILLWYWPFNMPVSLESDVCWDLYRIPRCKLVDQHFLFPSADVVQKLPLNLPRPQGQRWAWLSLESPAHNGNLQHNIFNITIGYRRDVDITVPYGELLPKEAGGHLEEDVPLNKSTLVCWVVSNFQNYQKRAAVYKELRDIVPVKVYGRWSGSALSNEALLPAISQCYFYLAFENSVAKDYITEKLWWNSYKGGAVPVVLGPPISDYKDVAPPNSFIHVDEFASVVRTRSHTETKQQVILYNSLHQHKVYSDLEAWDKANTYKASIGKL